MKKQWKIWWVNANEWTNLNCFEFEGVEAAARHPFNPIFSLGEWEKRKGWMRWAVGRPKRIENEWSQLICSSFLVGYGRSKPAEATSQQRRRASWRNEWTMKRGSTHSATQLTQHKTNHLFLLEWSWIGEWGGMKTWNLLNVWVELEWNGKLL